MTERPPEPESNPLCGADPLARALAALQPAPAVMDTNRLLFLAGRADRERAVTAWRWAFLGQCVLLVAVGCVATLYLARQANTEPTIVYRDRPVPTPGTPPSRAPEEAPPPRAADEYRSAAPVPFARTDQPEPVGVAEYLRVRNEVLTAGLGLIPDHRPRSAPPVSPDELERSLNLPPGVLTAPYFVRPPRSTPPDVPD